MAEEIRVATGGGREEGMKEGRERGRKDTYLHGRDEGGDGRGVHEVEAQEVIDTHGLELK